MIGLTSHGNKLTVQNRGAELTINFLSSERHTSTNACVLAWQASQLVQIQSHHYRIPEARGSETQREPTQTHTVSPNVCSAPYLVRALTQWFVVHIQRSLQHVTSKTGSARNGRFEGTVNFNTFFAYLPWVAPYKLFPATRDHNLWYVMLKCIATHFENASSLSNMIFKD